MTGLYNQFNRSSQVDVVRDDGGLDPRAVTNRENIFDRLSETQVGQIFSYLVPQDALRLGLTCKSMGLLSDMKGCSDNNVSINILNVFRAPTAVDHLKKQLWLTDEYLTNRISKDPIKAEYHLSRTLDLQIEAGRLSDYPIHRFCISGDGSTLVNQTTDNEATLYTRSDDGRWSHERRLKCLGKVAQFELTFDGTVILLSKLENDNVLQIWSRVDNGWCRKIYLEQGVDVQEIKANPRLHEFASIDSVGKVKVWHLEDGKWSSQQITENSPFIQYSYDGLSLITSEANGGIQFWSKNNGVWKLAQQLELNRPVSAVSFDASGHRMIAVSVNEVYLWDISGSRNIACGGQPQPESQEENRLKLLTKLRFSEPIVSAAINRNGDSVVAGSSRVIGFSEFKQNGVRAKSSKAIEEGSVKTLSFSPKGAEVIVNFDVGTGASLIIEKKTESGSFADASVKTIPNSPHFVAFSSDGLELYCASANDPAKVWDRSVKEGGSFSIEAIADWIYEKLGVTAGSFWY